MESEIHIKKTQDRVGFAEDIMKRYFKEMKSKSKIFVKPNIVSYEPYPTTTHPDVLRAVLKSLSKFKGEILVGDGVAVDTGDSGDVIKNHPLYKVCSEFGLELIDLHKHGFEKIKKDSMALRVSKVPFECDYIISLPVLKPHPWTAITGAIKNQFGFLQKRERVMLHSGLKNINKGIAILNTIIKPDLFIVDFVESFVGANERRHGGKKVNTGYMLAGKNPLLLDIKGLELLKTTNTHLRDKKPEDIEHIKYYMEIVYESRR